MKNTKENFYMSTLFHLITLYLWYLKTFPASILSNKQSAAELLENSNAFWFLRSGFFNNSAIVLYIKFFQAFIKKSKVKTVRI